MGEAPCVKWITFIQSENWRKGKKNLFAILRNYSVLQDVKEKIMRVPCWCTALNYSPPELHLLFVFPFYRWRDCNLVRWNNLVQTQKACGGSSEYGVVSLAVSVLL